MSHRTLRLSALRFHSYSAYEMKPRALPVEKEDEVIQAYQAGASLEVLALARGLGCSPVTVRNMLVRRGIQRRPCGVPARPAAPTKQRSSCGKKLPRAAFYREGIRTSECRSCVLKKNRAKYVLDPAYQRARILVACSWQVANSQRSHANKRTWATGWSEKQFEAAWDAQEGKCAVCRVDMMRNGRSPTAVCADHRPYDGKAEGLVVPAMQPASGHLRKEQGCL